MAVITVGTWGLLRRSIALALDAVPHSIDPAAVADFLKSQPGVTAIHDLHIWPMSTTDAALPAHLVMPEGNGDDAFLARIAKELHDLHKIEHTTLQIERGNQSVQCKLEPDHVV